VLDANPDLTDILDLLAQRRTADLTALSPTEQADLIARRTSELLPSTADLANLLSEDRRLVVKFGIDPTAADVHLGHAVPMILASRFQRMGHRVVFIVGNLTARIGDPSGRTVDRPPLTDADIARNLATYRAQVTPFFDFDRADFRFNRDWLGEVTLPQLLDVLARLPASAALQRDDFRTRLAAGTGLSLAELLYSVIMALDSVQIGADVEIGGLDQLLNMQMCRRVMDNAGQRPEVMVAAPLIEGTDGTGAKMSKSRGNSIALTATPGEMFGKLMSVPDRLVAGYLAALTELRDPEIAAFAGSHPMGVKTLLASDVTATIHGAEAAVVARDGFAAQFSRRRLSGMTAVPTMDRSDVHASTVAELFVTATALIGSMNQVRRVAAGGGLRMITETPGYGSRTVALPDANARVVDAIPVAEPGTRTFVTCGRAVIEIR
jgi:tyrosyl-tRNA synthetase